MADQREPKPGEGAPASDGGPGGTGELPETKPEPGATKRPSDRPTGDAALSLPPRYQILGYLGGGGMGHVVRALDRELRREVAIKALDPVFEDHPSGLDRLQREARAIAALRHPAIVAVYDIDVEAGILVMELVGGGSLAELLRKGEPLGERRSLEIIRPVLEALAVTHEAGIVHRDVKPSNILLDEEGRPKLCDFGIVHTLDSDVTRDGEQPGTPGYMAPEQLHGERSDERTDVYAAGATLYEMLTGRRLGKEPPRVRADVAAALRGEGIAPWLARVVARAVDEDPGARYAGARDLLEALEAPAPARRRSRRGLFVGLGAVLVAGVALPFALRPAGDGADAAGAEPPDPAVVAFLPFEDRTGDEDLAFTVHGVPRSLETRLSQQVEDATVVGYDVLRDVVEPGDRDRMRWIEVARERGAEVAVSGVVEAGEGGVLTVSARLARIHAGGVRTLAEVTASGGRAELDALIARVASGVVRSLYGIDPGSPRATHSLEALRNYHRGVDALRRASFGEAIDILEEVVALEPDYPEVWYHLSIARSWSGGAGNRAAFETFDRALASAEGRRERTLLRAMRLLAEQKPGEAAELLEPLRAEYPRDRDVLYTLGEAYHHGGEVRAGLAAFRAALHVAPGFLPAVIHPTRVYRATRDERNALECIELRRRYGQEDEAEGDGWLIRFATGQYDAVLADPLPEGRYARLDAMRARIGALLVRGQDARARELLQDEMSEMYAPVARWSSHAVLAAIAFRRGERAQAARWMEQAAVWASERRMASQRGEARAVLGLVHVLAGEEAAVRADLTAVDSEQYPPRVPRAVLVFRAAAGHLLERPELLEGALATADRDVRMFAEALRQEMAGDRSGAAATLALALDEPTEGYFDILILDALARNRDALGDRAGVRAACNDIERPAVYHPYREPALAHCRSAIGTRSQ